MKLGTLKPGCIAAVQVQKTASFKKLVFFFFPSPSPLFPFHWGKKHFSAWNLHPAWHRRSIPFRGARYQNDEEKGEKESKLKSKKPKRAQNLSPLPLPAQPQLELKCCFILSPDWGVCHGENPEDVPSNGHMTCPGHCRDHSRLQLTASSQKTLFNSMKTFIESIHFLEIIYLMLKIPFPRNLSVSLAPFFPMNPQEKWSFWVENQEMQPLLLLVCLKVKFMLQDLPEQVPMPLPRLKKKSMLAIHSTWEFFWIFFCCFYVKRW